MVLIRHGELPTAKLNVSEFHLWLHYNPASCWEAEGHSSSTCIPAMSMKETRIGFQSSLGLAQPQVTYLGSSWETSLSLPV